MVDSEKNVIGVDFGEKFTGIGEPLILENLCLSNNANTHDFSNACNDDYYVEDRWLVCILQFVRTSGYGNILNYGVIF